MKKIHRHDAACDKTPPTSGPEAMKQPAMVVCTPKAVPCR
jgi:hypothetical protein